MAIGVPGETPAGAVASSSSTSEQRLLRIDADGSIRVVDHRDESGGSVSAPVPLEITRIDTDWVSIVYSTQGDPVLLDIAVIANTVTGRYYSIPARLFFKHGSRWAWVSGGTLYLLLEHSFEPDFGGQIGIFEIEPTESPVARERNVPSDTVAGTFGSTGETLPAFAVDAEGTLIYRSPRDGFAQPRVRVLDSTGRVYPEPTEQIDFFFTGPDGDAYAVAVDDPILPDPVATVKRISITGGQVVFDEFGRTESIHSLESPVTGPSQPILLSGDDSIAVVSADSAIEIFRDGFDPDVDTLRSRSASSATTDPPIMTATRATWLIDGTLRVFSVTEFAFTDVAIESGYEINRIYPVGTEIGFDGLRYSDGASVRGTIDAETGSVTIEQLGNEPLIFELVPLN